MGGFEKAYARQQKLLPITIIEGSTFRDITKKFKTVRF